MHVCADHGVPCLFWNPGNQHHFQLWIEISWSHFFPHINKQQQKLKCLSKTLPLLRWPEMGSDLCAKEMLAQVCRGPQLGQVLGKAVSWESLHSIYHYDRAVSCSRCSISIFKFYLHPHVFQSEQNRVFYWLNTWDNGLRNPICYWKMPIVEDTGSSTIHFSKMNL